MSDNTYLETNFKKRAENNQKALKEMEQEKAYQEWVKIALNASLNRYY